MRIISVLNLKGGVGKTITALQMGYILHYRYGKNVLLIDNDKQGNLSRAMGVYSSDGECGTAQLLGGKDINLIRRYRGNWGLGIIDANMSLLTATYRLAEKEGYDVVHQFQSSKKALVEYGIPYDYVIIDNPPDLGLNVINALMVTDDVIIPTKIDQWAMDGLEIIRDQICDIKRYNPGINMAGIEWLLDHGYELFDEKIRYSEKVAESTLIGKNLEEYSPRSAAAVSYRRLVKEYRKRISKNERNRNIL